MAATLTPVPVHCLSICSKLSGSDGSVRERAQRAWTAGCWAKATTDGKASKPRPTPKVNHPPVVCIIVRGPGILRPVRCSNSAEYYKLLPRFTEDSLSHSFPSLAEAAVYCLAQGFDLPPEQCSMRFQPLQILPLLQMPDQH